MKPKFYVTTPIYYLNSEPHIGSAYTTIVADIVARYKRVSGYDVFFLTGTDEHGQKILNAATDKGISPQKFCDKLAGKFIGLWKELDITNDYFVRTTDDNHIKTVQYFVSKLVSNGDIYKGKYEGWYCIPDETFWNEEDLVDGKKCPTCGREVKWVSEENYFFKLSKYNDALLKLFKDNPDFVQPDFRRNEMMKILESGLKDLSISRTSFDWGIPMDEDPEHVIYVWVDALINYISALGYPVNLDNFEKFWPADVHLIGKEINRFHSIVWPAMLMAVGLSLPKKIYAHGWLTVNGEKISKSLGNAIDPRALMSVYGKDAIRYYLLRDIQFGRDGDFSEDNLITRINADLANDLGNLLHRTIAMIEKFNGGVIPQKNSEVGEPEEKLAKLIDNVIEKYRNEMDKLRFTHALDSVWELIRFGNKYIDLTEPWLLGKDPTKKGRLDTVLYNLADALRLVALMVSPVMPNTTKTIFERLGQDSEQTFESLYAEKLKANVNVTNGEPIFPRIDMKKHRKVIKMAEEVKKTVEKITEKNEVSKSKEVVEDNLISIDDFKKVEMRVGEIIEAEKVEKSNKLVKIQMNLGELGKRQVVAGIAKHYAPEELIGLKVVVVTNLKPAKLMGIESNGMIMAAKIGDKLTVLTVQRDIEPGAKIS